MKPREVNTQKACMITFQGIFLYNKSLGAWKILNCKEIPLLVNVKNIDFYLDLNEKMEMKLHIFPTLPQIKASPLI